ncbi:glutamate-rich WD repeat-containing protein 1 isoform X2 [Ceratina calcarata]|nr:glutamate-rich WD repeat-containing protein 1 isoform X2 [Ceratina calcarata]
MTNSYKEVPKEMECESVDEIDEDMAESESEEEDSAESEEGTEKENKSEVYLPGRPLKSNEELVVDKTAYKMLHHAESGAPCLSFDVILDRLGDNRENYPLDMFLIAGTQAASAHVNNVLVMRMKNLRGVEEDEDEEDSDDELEDNENLPIMSVAPIRHQGCVNRIRYTTVGETSIAASWSELGRVHIWNLEEQLKALENDELLRSYRKKAERSDGGGLKPLFSFKGHLSEGYGLDWCTTEAGTLASGDCKGNIHIWRLDNSGSTWHVDQRPYNTHAPHSVEDIQWSPNERHVLASCSVDKSIKIWDTRASPQSACMLSVSGTHTADINVISWNRKENQFLVSGGDDGLICVWDLRQFASNDSTPLAKFKQHMAPVTTVEWHPQEATVFASGGADDQIAQWDLSVEADRSEEAEEIKNLPPQLLFIHQGQTDIKELHWHPQCPGVVISTAHSGFNVFRTISI